jgi:hypothetical protein
MRFVSASPAGFRLEIAFKIDKKKMKKKEFYFSSRTKIFLTRKEKRACPRKTKKFPRRVVGDRSDQSIHVAMGSTPHLTELTRARNFSTFGVPLGCRPNAGEAHQK